MGSLPRDRVMANRAFFNTGVDFAGPIVTLVNKVQGRKNNKTHVALYVCFATKVINLELTSELTSAAFRATLRRFVGRRGNPQKIYNNNGTNIVGENRELTKMYKLVMAEVRTISDDVLAHQRIQWIFIPRGSPHMGGLWEAGVKSCKHHLKRTMGNKLLIDEELSLVLVQIEAYLNSRPLCQLSNNPTDLQPLTPVHFLVGEALTGIPKVDLQDVSINRLLRSQLLQRMVQEF
ncbi:uncharacterized protein LOC105696110 [Orussus abietinus]|uniref:uncharacterized protein LOC105696110 n=1 Tax=Orussus abietinus TaxID=222816 RepID=UPI000625CCE5|nr:uncharacterized protein LOC105696110 [Orussus abietinus]